MKKLIVVSLVIVLFTNFSFAQCPTDEVEIRVDILTDNYGYENYWTLSYESGDVIMQGGQGGVYENFTNYSETACVPEATSVILKYLMNTETEFLHQVDIGFMLIIY